MGGDAPSPAFPNLGRGKRREEHLGLQPGSCFSYLSVQKRPLGLGVNPGAVLGTCSADGAPGVPEIPRADLEILLRPR